MDVNELIGKYIALRDKKRELKAAFESRMREFDTALAQIEAQLLKSMNDVGVTSMRTSAGTAYVQDNRHYSIADWDQLRRFVLDSGVVELFQRRLSKRAVDDILANTDSLPPGVDMRVERVVNVRKS